MSQNINSEKLAQAIKKRKSPADVLYLKNPKNLKKEIENVIQNSKLKIKNSIVIMMGAGDIYTYTNNLIK